MNVILLVIDTLRYDHVGANGNDWIRTPNMDALASGSLVFDRAWAGSFPTIPHRLDAITGRWGAPFYPWIPFMFDSPALPRVLADSGYCTQLIHDTPHLVNGGHAFDWPFHAWTFVRGAEVDRPWIDDGGLAHPENWAPDPMFDFFGDPEMTETANTMMLTYSRANRGRRGHEDWNAARLFLTGAEFLRANEARERFFLWLDCFDPHEPWDAPPEFVRMYDTTEGYDGRIDPRAFVGRNDDRLSEAGKSRVAACYAAKVSWVDRWLGEFLEALQETGLDEKTAVILTADHGTRLREFGRFGKASPVTEYESHVPLMIRAPGGPAGRSDQIAQPQDIFATVLGLAGVDAPEGTDGRDLLAAASAGGRSVALAGPSNGFWSGAAEEVAFTVYGAEHYLQFAPRPESCRLFAYGSTQDVAAANPGTVADLRSAGLEELARRQVAPAVLDWLAGEGAGPFPDESCPHRAPDGWKIYFSQLLNRR